jgi:HSP20 family molecular chaperone IbpA
MTSNSSLHAEVQTIVLVSPAVMRDRLDTTYSLVTARAYELYEARGRIDGYDVQDWVHAEHEIIHACRHNLIESPDSFHLRARMPGAFAADQIRVCVEPRRVIFEAERQVSVTFTDGKSTRTAQRSQRILRTEELSAKVDPTAANATLQGNLLEITLPKATTRLEPRNIPITAAAVAGK